MRRACASPAPFASAFCSRRRSPPPLLTTTGSEREEEEEKEETGRERQLRRPLAFPSARGKMATLGSEPQPFPAAALAVAAGGVGGGGCGGGGALGLQPLNRGLERALEEAAHSGGLNLSGRKLKEFPRSASALTHDLSDTVRAGETRGDGAAGVPPSGGEERRLNLRGIPLSPPSPPRAHCFHSHLDLWGEQLCVDLIAVRGAYPLSSPPAQLAA